MSEVSGIQKIIVNAIRHSYHVKFGPFKVCPECSGLLNTCQLCQGRKRVSVAEIKAFNNPITRMLREHKAKKIK